MSKITIITVCYNDKLALIRTIESVESQKFELEHLVIDGASTDGTLEFLKAYQLNNPKFKYVSEADKGVYDAINKGVTLSSSEYLLVLNAGDTFGSDDVLNSIFSSDHYTGQNYLVGRVNYIYKSGKVKQDQVKFPSKNNLECSHQAFIYKKELHSILGLYSLTYKSASDYDFFSKIYQKYGLFQSEKYPYVIAVREKFGKDMSDTLKHTLEMINIDYKNRFYMQIFSKRFKEVVIKLVKIAKGAL